MIQKLKRRFIFLATASLLLLLTVLVLGMNLINYTTVRRNADEILTILSHNKGNFPSEEESEKFPAHMSPEIPYESRYFSILLNQKGEIVLVDTNRIVSVENSEVMTYAQAAMEKGSDRGYVAHFRFLRSDEEDHTIRITFLDWGRQLEAVRNFGISSVGIALFGLIVAFFILFFCSGRIIQPIAESYEKQKRFITDAGHEMKTPLTIIRANADILEMDYGENDAIHDIQQQAQRLSDLTAKLVQLSRMEEAEHSLAMIEFPLSEIVQETILSFVTPAQQQNKEIVYTIQPLLALYGNAKAIEQLVSILLDNALKYSPPHTAIEISLHQNGHSAVLSVYNRSAFPLAQTDLAHIFDRFYRTDPSRNSQTGGHGIGLSIARAITDAHGGKLQAIIEQENAFRITATFPGSLTGKHSLS